MTQKDADLFKEVQAKAVDTVTEIMNENGGELINLAVGQGAGNLSTSLLSSLAMAAQARCPSAIEFGQWHIETWYSSPFPQEYARYVPMHHIQFEILFFWISKVVFIQYANNEM